MIEDMQPSKASKKPYPVMIATANQSRLHGDKIENVICHRVRNEGEFYLVRWRTDTTDISTVPHSWHHVDEFQDLEPHRLHLLQIYVDSTRQNTQLFPPNPLLDKSTVRKRKYQNTSDESRPAPAQRDLPTSITKNTILNKITFNCRLKTLSGGKIEGVLDAESFDSRDLPTKEMKEEALSAPTIQADKLIRKVFLKTLTKFNKDISVARSRTTSYPVTLANTLDASSPSLNFEFTDEYVFHDEADSPDLAGLVGCESCRPNMAQNVGCQYTRKCECLEYAAVDEGRLNEQERKRYNRDMKKLKHDPNFFMDTSPYPKRFPYTLNDQLLVTFYLESRHVIYECNHLCNCGDLCKTKVTHRGRQVSLEIFKTKTRGWGLKCPKPLRRGQFIDFYYGEMVRKEISEERLNKATSNDKASYIFAMDKFKDNPVNEWEEPMHKFDIDGEFKGGPVRFMNHSCDPNCRQFVVSWNKNDPRIYNLALFALEDIPAGTELTFNYIDLDEEEEAEQNESSQVAEATEESVRCLCGADNCRGILWA